MQQNVSTNFSLHSVHFSSASVNSLQVRYPHLFPDSRMSASSDLDDPNDLGRPEHAILNNKLGSWCAYYSRAIEWLELDLGSDQTIYGVAVQGSHDSNSKVTKYIISLRANGASEDTWLFEAVCSLVSLMLTILLFRYV